MTTTQSQQASLLIAALHVVNARAADIQANAEASALAWHPAEKAWSVAQVFEHLCATNESYIVAMGSVIDRRGGASAGINASWKSTFVGRLLINAMVSPRKLPAPKKWQPGPTPRENVIATFLQQQHAIEALIERSLRGEWQRMKVASPVSSLIRMNLGDAFTLLVRHEERHFAQIDRALAAHASVVISPIAPGSVAV